MRITVPLVLLASIGVTSFSTFARADGKGAPAVAPTPTSAQRPAARNVPTPALKPAVTVQAKHALGAVGATIDLRAVVTTKDGDPVPHAHLSFLVDGRMVGGVSTDENGLAKTAYAVPSTLGLGLHPFTVSFEGNDTLSGAQAAGEISVVKSAVHLATKVSSTSVMVGEKIELEGNLKRITDGKDVDGREIEIVVDGAVVKKVATTPGGFSFSMPAPKSPKDVVVEARFDGDSLYLANKSKKHVVSVSAAPNPKPPKPLVVLQMQEPPKVLLVGQTATVSAIAVALPQKTPVPNLPISFWLKNNWSGEPDSLGLGEAKTNALGVAVVTYKAGQKYDGKMVAYFRPDGSWYDAGEPLQWHNAVRVLPAPLKITITGPSTAKINEKKTYTVKVVRATDNAPVSYPHLRLPSTSVSFPGGVPLTANENGEATFSYTFNSSDGIGTQKIRVRFDDEDNGKWECSYLDSFGVKAVQVGPAEN